MTAIASYRSFHPIAMFPRIYAGSYCWNQLKQQRPDLFDGLDDERAATEAHHDRPRKASWPDTKGSLSASGLSNC